MAFQWCTQVACWSWTCTNAPVESTCKYTVYPMNMIDNIRHISALFHIATCCCGIILAWNVEIFLRAIYRYLQY